MEHGRQNLTLRTMSRVAAVLGVETADLLVTPAATIRPVGRPRAVRSVEGVVPLMSLEAAAGAFGPVADVDIRGWLRVPGTVVAGAFAARVVGASMEPRIPRGSVVLFQPVSRSIEGRIVLVQHRALWDPETGGSYTVKRVRTRAVTVDGQERLLVRLEPVNEAYETIELTLDDGELRVVAEMVRVLP